MSAPGLGITLGKPVHGTIRFARRQRASVAEAARTSARSYGTDQEQNNEQTNCSFISQQVQEALRITVDDLARRFTQEVRDGDL